MDINLGTVIECLLAGYRRYYNVTRFDGGYNPPPEEFKGICEADKLTPPDLPEDVSFNALCEYYEKAEGYFLFHRNELWTTHQEEFIFLFSVPALPLRALKALPLRAGLTQRSSKRGTRSSTKLSAKG